MPLVALVCVSLLALADGPPPPLDVATEYQHARAAAGRTPDDQVRLALWCEAHGLTAERLRHLALAVLADPTHATARGLAGLVARDGKWVAPDAVARDVRDDPATKAILDEYDARRSKTPYTADAQWALGQWADEQGLHDQARAHFTAVTRLDPARDQAWKRLGYKKHDGQWATDAQVAAARAEGDAQKHADRTWKPLLEKWRGMLDKPAKRDEARSLLLGVTDPLALPSIGRVFGTDRASDQQVAVGLLGQIESPQASRSLAALAVLSAAPDVRRAALETLRRRDPRDFIGFWIALIRAPIKYEVKPVNGPGSPGVLFVQGEKANTQRVYRPMDVPSLPNALNASFTTDSNGLPVYVIDRGLLNRQNMILLPRQINAFDQQAAAAPGRIAQVASDLHLNSAATRALDKFATPRPLTDFGLGNGIPVDSSVGLMAEDYARAGIVGARTAVVRNQIQIPIGQMLRESQMSATIAQQQLASDVAGLESYNAAIRRGNEPVVLALGEVTGANYGEDREKWNRWWVDAQGYAITESSTSSVPTFVEDVPINFTPTATPILADQIVGYARPRHACFAAGTPVRTVAGAKAIETIRRGDLVLVEDTVSGALSYQPVLTAFHNPPSSTYRVKLGEDEVVATGIHRFWKAGKGWTMARDLKAGDSLRVLGGVATVAAVTQEQMQPVFNLEVAAGRSFFVGTLGALVHDNSLVEATPNPFDAPRAVAVAR